MTKRTELQHRRAEARARAMARMLDRALSRRTTGLDGLAKKAVGTKLGPVEDDPELDHP
jgi:hypothetical protein